MTREEAINALTHCLVCGRWHTGQTCDGCWVDQHRCATPEQAVAILQQAVVIGREAAPILAALKAALK